MVVLEDVDVEVEVVVDVDVVVLVKVAVRPCTPLVAAWKAASSALNIATTLVRPGAPTPEVEAALAFISVWTVCASVVLMVFNWLRAVCRDVVCPVARVAESAWIYVLMAPTYWRRAV